MSKILDTLKKLIRLSSNNSNQHEAEAAMLKAQQIAIQNNIDIASVSINEETKGKEYLKETKDMGQRLPICHKFTSTLICKYFNVAIILCGGRNSGRTVNFIGTSENVEFAKFAHDYLNETFLNCWRKYKEDNNKPLNFRETYLYGLYSGLKTKLETNKQKLEQDIAEEYKGKYTLVILDDSAQLELAKNKFYPKLTNCKSYNITKRDTETFSAGYEKGQSININRQIS